ncbi:HET-domain-containing protein, partial [Pleomassaria siparia CBS 279.74]
MSHNSSGSSEGTRERSGSASTEPEPKLKKYIYKRLRNPDCLRLIKLRPARDQQEDIDLEIIQVSIDELTSRESSEDTKGERNKTLNGNHGIDSELARKKEPVDDDDNDNDDTDNNGSSGDDSDDCASGRGGGGSVQSRIKSQIGIPGRQLSYEAVSWCWGKESDDQVLRVHDGDHVREFRVSPNLRNALWALRKSNVVRYLWMDAICINQKNTEERNEQVPRMDKIYGMADNVCIWLGDADEDSNLAMSFIPKVLELWDFDTLIENKEMSKNWAALITLMKRPWFSRRWVVQEIALSPSAGTIYCGKKHASWQDFADAVSLFVEVESATHRLSEVMVLDKDFGNIPEFFGDVSSLGAALLVDATSNLFRDKYSTTTGRRKALAERKPLSSLEYLVSRLPVFEATQPRDTIYALLAISRDTSPEHIETGPNSPGHSREETHALRVFAPPARGFMKQSYNVDYKLPVIDVYQQFIQFSIRKSDPLRALDIICRPWAPRVLKSHDDPDYLSLPSKRRGKKVFKGDQEIPLPSWIPALSGAAFQMAEHPTLGLRMERQNADPLVGLPDQSGHRTYSAAGDRALNLETVKFRKWKFFENPKSHYPVYSMWVSGFVLDEVSTVEHLAQNGNFPYQWLWAGGWTNMDQYPEESFWRTLVADRGHLGLNPPTYFPRACKEAMKFKAKTMSRTGGNLDTNKLIHEGRCTIVAEFLRRMQEVIWNRQLMRTKDNRLGLVRDDVSPGFKVCILYGCSVPVILREIPKSQLELETEQNELFEERWIQLKNSVSSLQAIWRENRDRKRSNAKGKAPSNGSNSENTADPSRALNNETETGEGRNPFEGPSSASLVEDGIEQSNIETKHVYVNTTAKPPQRSGTLPDNTEHVKKEELRVKWMEDFEKRKQEGKEKVKPSYYRFLGECYVHGMMNGEAIGLQNQEHIKEALFEL